MKARAYHLAGMHVVVCLLMSADLTAQNSSLAGGSGGRSYTIKCSEGDVLVGLRAGYGQWIDRIGVLCATAYIGDGGWTTAAAQPATMVGGSGGNMTSPKCPAGYAIKSFSGKAGWYVNSIIAECRKLGNGARTLSTSSRISVNGYAGGGATYGPGSAYTCPDAKPAIGIRGRADIYVDAFGLICGYIMPSVPPPASPRNTDVTTRRPTFRWDPAERVDQGHRICINVSTTASCSVSGTVASPSIGGTTTMWTPTADLPFQRGELLYWRVEACNKNGCKHGVASFRFMP